MTQLGKDIIDALADAVQMTLVPASCRPTLTITHADGSIETRELADVAIDEMRVELKTRRAGGEIDSNRYAEDDTRYRQMQHDAELQMVQAQRVLSSAGDIDHVIGLLSDLGRSIDRLTPEMKRQALRGLFARKIIDTAGEIVRLEPQAWIARAFGELVWAWRHTQSAPASAGEAGFIPNLTPTGLEPAIGISPQTAWLLERIAA